MLTSCSSGMSSGSVEGYYKFNRSEITEIVGTSQMSDPVKATVISKENADQFLNQLEDLELRPENTESNLKGWEYSFTIKYENESTVQITLSKKGAVIDGENYKIGTYNANDFSVFFD